MGFMKLSSQVPSSSSVTWDDVMNIKKLFGLSCLFPSQSQVLAKEVSASVGLGDFWVLAQPQKVRLC